MENKIEILEAENEKLNQIVTEAVGEEEHELDNRINTLLQNNMQLEDNIKAWKIKYEQIQE